MEKNLEISRKSAEEGIVLLENRDTVLPISIGSTVALYGTGVKHTIKGGTGSGDVNSKYVISIYEGMKNLGYEITTDDWLNKYDKIYSEERNRWRDRIWDKAAKMGETVPGKRIFYSYCNTPFRMPDGEHPNKTKAEYAIIVLSRTSGEGKDRINEKGDYKLSDKEDLLISEINKLYHKIVLILNTGGIVELDFLEKYQNIKSVLYILQPGIEAGTAVANIISGNVTPSGKLTDTWALKYEDYPNANTFSHNSGNTEVEQYLEDIFVGYRYFDTFEVKPRYCFGYGMSYTEFNIEPLQSIKKHNNIISIRANVTNTGSRYAGKEVVQVYVSCPCGSMIKERKRLCGFAKTKLLQPGECEQLKIDISLDEFYSYSEEYVSWVLEKGIYLLYIGKSIQKAKPFLKICVNEERKISVKATFQNGDFNDNAKIFHSFYTKIPKIRNIDFNLELPQIEIRKEDYTAAENQNFRSYVTNFDDSEMITKNLTNDELVSLLVGDFSGGEGGELGAAGTLVAGSGAQTTQKLMKYGINPIVLADGPAGLRLTRDYFVKDGKIVPQPLEANLECGFLLKEHNVIDGEMHHQYCTAFPIGTLLAQTWNPSLIEEVGAAISNEMKCFGVSIILSPGVNIHRNPLCGRNFEYYSEDPFLTGKIASSMISGIQSQTSTGACIKHMACNNQEDSRKTSDSVVSDRALREIYLKGFEIAVKESSPAAIMTSYNKINGVYSANNLQLCSRLCRDEWSYEGVIMTDWTSTQYSPDCTAAGCIHVGVDLIMPGAQGDINSIDNEILNGNLLRQELCACASRIVRLISKLTS